MTFTSQIPETLILSPRPLPHSAHQQLHPQLPTGAHHIPCFDYSLGSNSQKCQSIYGKSHSLSDVSLASSLYCGGRELFMNYLIVFFGFHTNVRKNVEEFC